MDKEKIIFRYLEEFGVNKNVLTYLKQNNIYLVKSFERVWGKNFDLQRDEKAFYEKLRSDLSKIQIFDNGSIWFSSTRYPKTEVLSDFERNSGFLALNAEQDKKYESIESNFYISFEGGQIVKREVTLKKQNIDNQPSYDGEFIETIEGEISKEKTVKSASFFHSPVPIPAKPLETRIEKVSKFGKTPIGSEQQDYNTPLWHLITTGEIKNQHLIDKLNLEIFSAKYKFRLLKQNIFARVKAGSQTNLFEQLRAQCMELLVNENPDEIIHSDFSMKGKDENICTWTLEKVTESSRNTVFQMDFQNNEQFRQQVLQPFLIDYAQTNSIIRGRVNPTDTGLFQYRAFSTTNNVITINNVSQEYANYVSTEIRRIEPVIYNRQMEQNEKTRQQIEGLGYQKINKKSGGFLDIFLLVFISGYALGLLFCVIIMMLK